jgi:methionyl aminopeptidase
MSIESQHDLAGIKHVSEAVGSTLRQMRAYAAPGMSTFELDEYGGQLLKAYGARSAPRETYGFPGWTCISLNHEIAHGMPSTKKILREGDLINIDVSAELNGFWADNGGSFVLGNDIHHHHHLVHTSREILLHAIRNIKGGVRISDVGGLIEKQAKRAGYKVIRNLVGHGVGRQLHEHPSEIPNYFDPNNKLRFRKNTVVAVETFISTNATYARDSGDGWTLIGNKPGYVVQHEHTILITDHEPVILTESNQL